jgi:hypothetical protein
MTLSLRAILILAKGSRYGYSDAQIMDAVQSYMFGSEHPDVVGYRTQRDGATPQPARYPNGKIGRDAGRGGKGVRVRYPAFAGMTRFIPVIPVLSAQTRGSWLQCPLDRKPRLH